MEKFCVPTRVTPRDASPRRVRPDNRVGPVAGVEGVLEGDVVGRVDSGERVEDLAEDSRVVNAVASAHDSAVVTTRPPCNAQRGSILFLSVSAGLRIPDLRPQECVCCRSSRRIPAR